MRWVLVFLTTALPFSPTAADVGYDYGTPPHALWLTLDVGPTFDFDYFLGTEFGFTLNWFPLGDYLHLGAVYRYATGEVLEPEGERLNLHTVAGLVGYGSFNDPVGYYTGFMLGRTGWTAASPAPSARGGPSPSASTPTCCSRRATCRG
jgi:hypothetical protein